MKKWPFYSFLILLGLSCKSPVVQTEDKDLVNLSCDAETVETIDGVQFFSSSDPNINFSVGESQSNEYSRSGNFCAKVDSNHNYTLGVTLSNFEEGQYLRFSVWQKKGNERAYLSVIIRGQDYENQLVSTYYTATNEEDDWIQHNISLLVTDKIDEIEVVVTGGGREAYFDDFEYTQLKEIPENDLLEDIQIVLSESSKNRLKYFISEAKKGPVIKAEQKSYLKGKLKTEDGFDKMKIKLKGDWTDHLSSGKPSCRIKMGGNAAYHGLKTFSLHHAKTRNYLDEWLVHKMAYKEDVLATTYDFVNVKVNNRSFGVYALEEHFDKQLLEQRNRREGPIVKFDESGVWALAFLESDSVKLADFPYYESSFISMFKENRTLGSPTLSKNFSEASGLMSLFKHGTGKTSDIFDIEKLAKYYAIIDMCGGLHATTWHNRRFYYNPVTEKLEHILYDAMPFNHGDNFYISIQNQLYSGSRSKDVSLDVALLLDNEFKAAYLYEVERMSQPTYLDSLFNGLEGELDSLIRSIQIEEPYYRFNKNRYYANAANLRSSLPSLSKRWDEFIDEHQSIYGLVDNKVYESRDDSLFVKEVSVNAYLEKIDSCNYLLRVENYHLNDISLCGYELKKWKNHAQAFDQEITLTGFDTVAAETVIKFKDAPNKLFIKVSNRRDRFYAVKVINWRKPNLETTRMSLADQPNKTSYKVVGEKAIFSGAVEISNLIYIPEDLAVEIKPGTSIEFRNGGGLVVSNSFQAVGTSNQGIEIFCEDGTSQGLTILNGDFARFEHVHFKGLSNLNYKNWELTGAITIYETSVYMSNINIDSSLAEDALNIIRSKFEINNLRLNTTTSDGFDADFCTGVLSDSYFGDTGNDCIDFSGSQITIENVTIENSGDKGISGGERSILSLANISITGAITGIASKDRSKVIGDEISISKTSYGLMAFEKKAEYGPATLVLTNTEITETDTLMLIDRGSEISLNGVAKKGKVKIDVEKLYARFNK